MADVKISQLPQATLPLTGAEVFPIVQNGVTVQAPVGNVGTVSTIAALRGVTPTSNAAVYVEGYHTIGDAGAGNFYAVTGAATGTYVDNGGTIIVPTGGDGSSAWLRNVDGVLYVDYFGAVGDGVADDTAAIQATLDSIADPVGGVQLGANKQYRITSSIIVLRGRGIHGDGTPEIVADFSSPSWGGDYVAVKFLCDRAYSAAEINAAWAQKTYGFCITGTNNSSIISTGAKFYTSVVITLGQAVNFSWIWGTFENMKVRQFDTALELNEVWSSVFLNVQINYCRQGIYINGKVVNVTFTDINIENSTSDNTSSTDFRYGVYVRSNSRYSGVEGRPEGMTFSQGLIYGHHYNLYLQNALLINFTNMILDAGVTNSVRIISPHDYVISGCYIANITANTACIAFAPVAVGTSASGTIRDNFLWNASNAVNVDGIAFESTGSASRYGITIDSNFGYLLNRLVYAPICPIYSTITNNYAELHKGNSLIQIVVGGAGTTIDGNKCGTLNTGVTYVVPVLCHPTTSENLNIGDNLSPTHKSYAANTVRLVAGATTIQLPNDFYDATTGDTFIRPVTLANPRANPGSRWWVAENNSFSSSQFNLTTPLGVDLIISYTTKAIPFSSTVV